MSTDGACKTGPERSEFIWALTLAAISVVAQLALVWAFEFFPSVDGPAHVHLAHSFVEALRGDPFYSELIELNRHLNPNLATQSILVVLMAIFPPFVAEKIWLTLYFLTFALAAAYALHGINRRSLCLLPLAVFCSISFPLAFGFYNFSFSVVVFLAWFGYWWRNRQSAHLRVVLGHGALSILALSTHVFAFVVTLTAIGVATAASVVSETHRRWQMKAARAQPWHRQLLHHALPPALGSLPALLAALYFLFYRFGSRTVGGATNIGFTHTDRLTDLVTASSFAPYDRLESFATISFVLASIFLLAFLLRHRDSTTNGDPLAACFAVFFILYLLMPEQWIVRWMPARFQPLVFIALFLWLAALISASLSLKHWKSIGVVGIVLVLASVALRFPSFTRLNDYYQELASTAPHIAKNSTLIALRLHHRMHDKPFPAKVDVLIQAGSRLATARHSVDLKNFQGQSSDHPIQFRTGISATAALGGDRAITSLPPQIKLMNYERQTGRAIDYVILYGFRDAVANKDALAQLDAQLDATYRLIYTSRPRGLTQLYARNHIAPIAEEQHIEDEAARPVHSALD